MYETLYFTFEDALNNLFLLKFGRLMDMVNACKPLIKFGYIKLRIEQTHILLVTIHETLLRIIRCDITQKLTISLFIPYLYFTKIFVIVLVVLIKTIRIELLCFMASMFVCQAFYILSNCY